MPPFYFSSACPNFANDIRPIGAVGDKVGKVPGTPVIPLNSQVPRVSSK